MSVWCQTTTDRPDETSRTRCLAGPFGLLLNGHERKPVVLEGSKIPTRSMNQSALRSVSPSFSLFSSFLLFLFLLMQGCHLDRQGRAGIIPRRTYQRSFPVAAASSSAGCPVLPGPSRPCPSSASTTRDGVLSCPGRCRGREDRGAAGRRG